MDEKIKAEMNKQFIISKHKDIVKREGSDKLLEYVLSTDFFQAPASTRFHLAIPGGLAQHSLNVYDLLTEKNSRYGLGYSDETIFICGMYHDLCKVNFYKEATDPATEAQMKYLVSLAGPEMAAISMSKKHVSALIDWHKNGKNGDKPEVTTEYVIEDQLPIGHGEKSMMLINRYIELTPNEAMAIRWHMVAFDPGIHFSYPSGYSFNRAINSCSLVTALFTADIEAGNLVESKIKE